MKNAGVILLLLIGAASLSSADAAWAETFTHRSITLEVPPGWSAHLPNRNIDQILLFSPNNTCRVMATFQPSFGMDSKKSAELMIQRLFKNSVITPVPGPPGQEGYYRFTVRPPDPKSQPMEVTVFSHGQALLHWSEIGEVDQYADDIKIIWNSLKSSDPARQSLIDALYKR